MASSEGRSWYCACAFDLTFCTSYSVPCKVFRARQCETFGAVCQLNKNAAKVTQSFARNGYARLSATSTAYKVPLVGTVPRAPEFQGTEIGVVQSLS